MTYKPMLAYKFNNKKVNWTEPVYIQPKLDGVRCLITKAGAYSRTGKQFKNLALGKTNAVETPLLSDNT